jgi:hypothetical protein
MCEGWYEKDWKSQPVHLIYLQVVFIVWLGMLSSSCRWVHQFWNLHLSRNW